MKEGALSIAEPRKFCAFGHLQWFVVGRETQPRQMTIIGFVPSANGDGLWLVGRRNRGGWFYAFRLKRRLVVRGTLNHGDCRPMATKQGFSFSGRDRKRWVPF